MKIPCKTIQRIGQINTNGISPLNISPWKYHVKQYKELDKLIQMVYHLWNISPLNYHVNQCRIIEQKHEMNNERIILIIKTSA